MARELLKIVDLLQRAVEALGAANKFFVRVAQDSEPASIDFRMAQAGLIQHFEFTFELARSVIYRWMRDHGPRREDIDLPLTRRDLFRLASRAGLIEDPDAWFTYADAQNASSHTCNPQIAAEVCASAQSFSAKVLVLVRRARGIQSGS